jgi:hypothetical protein
MKSLTNTNLGIVHLHCAHWSKLRQSWSPTAPDRISVSASVSVLINSGIPSRNCIGRLPAESGSKSRKRAEMLSVSEILALPLSICLDVFGSGDATSISMMYKDG